MSKIRVLPPEVVNRIAAGEVVERPASVLKELIENSIDAGATQIFARLEEGGRKKIAIRDNGSGIGPEDLLLAFASHATSKLAEEELLNSLLGVATMGFRGEALASIAAVAMVEVISRTHGSEHAYRYRPDVGGEPEPTAGEPGTSIEVRNLFYNMPARHKFMRTSNTELSHSLAQFTRLALGLPGIHFRLEHGAKKLLDLPAVDGLRDRIDQVVGKQTAEKLIEIKAKKSAPGVRVTGFVGAPSLHRKDNREQHFFVNGRWVRDRLFSHALRSAYEGFQIPGKQPVAYIFVDIPPEEVDVNAHPTKMEVRFREPSQVYGALRGAVRKALEGAVDPVWGAPRPGHASATAGYSSRLTPAGRAEVFSKGETAEVRPRSGNSPATGRQGAADTAAPSAWIRGGRSAPSASPAPTEDFPFVEAADAEPSSVEPRGADSPGTHSPSGLSQPGTVHSPGRVGRHGVQLLDSYLLLEESDGITLIDQHALHEKILFEEVYPQLSGSVVESQRLLVPDVFDLPADFVPLVEEVAAKVAPFGFDIALFGEQALGVHAIPALFDREVGSTDTQGILWAIFESARDGWSRPEETGAETAPKRRGGGKKSPQAVYLELRRLASMIACKRAVKAGMPLTSEEIQSLLRRSDLADDPRFCPHGRPTTVFLSRREIERKSDRK